MPELVEPQKYDGLAPGRYLGLPGIARLALAARHPGPLVVITTGERFESYQDLNAFGVTGSFNPDLPDWQERDDRVIVSVKHALKAFPKDPQGYALHLGLGGSYPRDELLSQLLRLGYTRDAMPGLVVRGDTLTIFLDPEDQGDSLRLEFFGDELDALRYHDEARESYHLAPLAGIEVPADLLTTRLLEHLPGTVLLDGPELFHGETAAEEASWLFEHLSGRRVVSFGRDPLELPSGDLPVTPLSYYRGRLSAFAGELETWLGEGYSVTLLVRFERTGRYLQEKVVERLDSRWLRSLSHHPGVLGLGVAAHARGGFRDEGRREVVLTEDLLYGFQGGRKLRRLPGRRLHDASQLTVGDYLIHPDHGIGRFLGLEPRRVVGVTRDYLILQYAGEGKLYLPVEQLPLLRRHPGTTDTPPRLSTLGTNEWARTREKARVNAQELAAHLIKTYARRQVSRGVALPFIPDWDPLMAESFPYQPTPDQERAIEATLADMEREVPMDRLISGDVGFGKTEIAIRAAHRAVGHGKQVAMLVPTTVLARQHYQTFGERFGNLPVRVEMLSRFSGDREATAIRRGLRDGTVDIVIGTHRLLGDGVAFKDLALLIIDEEHRFGVAQKERLKALKANLEVLSLTATPIPRTLYMSLVGLRDVSQILTPPEGRKPIQTVLQPFDPMTVREAVMFELERGGKVYYIHDRIGSIAGRARSLQQLLPEARIGVGHGQMDSEELEEVMLRFQEGAYDVLLSTTIVESGLDISGANTLVIERADRLGLAQLYQLRGRVGRRRSEAWAYLLYPGRLTEPAQRRLYAIAELNDLGSGHLLAEKDMEIRGVGNLLGAEQHGHVSAVSLAVYTEMLAEEIAKLKGEARKVERPMVAIDLSLDARISPGYLQDDDARIAFYGRLSEADGLAEVGRIARELRQAFGSFPSEVHSFIELVKLRLLAAAKGVVSIKEHMTDVQISFEQDSVDYDARKLRELPFRVTPTRYPPGFSVARRGLRDEKLIVALQQLLYLCG